MIVVTVVTVKSFNTRERRFSLLSVHVTNGLLKWSYCCSHQDNMLSLSIFTYFLFIYLKKCQLVTFYHRIDLFWCCIKTNIALHTRCLFCRIMMSSW